MYGSSFITSSSVFFVHDSGARVLGGLFSFCLPLLSVFIVLCLPVGDRLFCEQYGEDCRFTGYWMMGDCLIILGATGLVTSQCYFLEEIS